MSLCGRFSVAHKRIPIERTEQVEHHRWTPSAPGARGLAPIDGPTRALLHQMRWRKAPPAGRRRWAVLAIVLALHGLFVWFTWHAMQAGKPETARRERRDALQVRLIPAASKAAPAPSEQAPPPPLPPPRPAVREPPAKHAMTVALPEPEPEPAATVAPAPRIYDDTGQPMLPAAPSSAPSAAPGYVQRMPQGDSQVMKHDHPITYKATRFDKDWNHGSSSVDDALKRAVDKSTVTHTFHIAPGVRIHCAIAFAALAGGCGGDPPPKPSSKSQDMRLNMAPANPLVPGLPTPKPPSVEECIAIYRADKPLPQGCPVDTPTRAVDEELRERAAHQLDQDGR